MFWLFIILAIIKPNKSAITPVTPRVCPTVRVPVRLVFPFTSRFAARVVSEATSRVPVMPALPPTVRASATLRLPAEPSAAAAISTSPFRVVSHSTLN